MKMIDVVVEIPEKIKMGDDWYEYSGEYRIPNNEEVIYSIPNSSLHSCHSSSFTVKYHIYNEARWRAKKGDEYFFISSIGIVVDGLDCGFKANNSQYNIGNYFRTAEEAEEKLKLIKEVLK